MYVDLEKQLRKAKKRKINPDERDMVIKRSMRSVIVKSMDEFHKEMQNKYVTDIHINYIPQEVMEWANN
jgi:hypothetical protein